MLLYKLRTLESFIWQIDFITTIYFVKRRECLYFLECGDKGTLFAIHKLFHTTKEYFRKCVYGAMFLGN